MMLCKAFGIALFVVAFFWINIAAEECPLLTLNYRSGWFYFLWGVPVSLASLGMWLYGVAWRI